MPNTKILFVDDDEKILKGIERQQGDDFDITTALGPHEALELLEEEGPFAVVVSDMRMPEMNGVQLLKRVREMHPDTVRMILTGYAELDTTIDAVNEGHIFRFLAKPCDEDVMAGSLQAGLRQYELVEAERELVEGTLHGSVKVLADVLSLVNPLAFGQTTRVRSIVDGMLSRLTIADQWQVEIAAMLSALGCVTLPSELLEKKLSGKLLTKDEQAEFEKHPLLASELLQNIPRMEEVSAIIGGLSSNAGAGTSKAILQKTSIIKLAQDFDFQEIKTGSPLHALDEVKKSKSQYDAEILEALSDFVKEEKDVQVIEVEIDQVVLGMVLAADIYNEGGTLLMSKGQMITPSALRMLDNISSNQSFSGSLLIVSPKEACLAS